MTTRCRTSDRLADDLRRELAQRRSEKVIYEQCCSLLRQLGMPVYRLSQARASKQTSGLPDLIAFPGPRTLKTDYGTLHWFAQMLCVEVKRVGGKQSPAQKEFERLCSTVPGVRYVVVDDPQKLADWIGGADAH